ncbi:MAG TPA: exodeoxyribonuclease III [Porticoccaceae bacterium]|nr:exodeoxyribonuclease III [Porticoccaceae bacterium]
MRLVSWNVNGIRAVMKKGFADFLAQLDADIICLQETKAQDDQVVEALASIDHYQVSCNSAERKGYSGTAILSRTAPASVTFDMGVLEHDQEGRVIAAEFDNYYLVTVYTPNSGAELRRLEYRQQWDADFLSYIKRLEEHKPVVLCGDLNVAHREIDIARPKPNYNKTAGYTQVEIDGMDNLINAGFVDTYRWQHPDTVKYSWWSFRAGARAKNIGWRIDYFLVSQALAERIHHTDILNEVMGSDHCPVVLELKT